jgi:hypothetical protein
VKEGGVTQANLDRFEKGAKGVVSNAHIDIVNRIATPGC